MRIKNIKYKLYHENLDNLSCDSQKTKIKNQLFKPNLNNEEIKMLCIMKSSSLPFLNFQSKITSTNHKKQNKLLNPSKYHFNLNLQKNKRIFVDNPLLILKDKV